MPDPLLHSRLLSLLLAFAPLASNAEQLSASGSSAAWAPAAAASAPTAGTRKYHPGHYVAMNKNDANADITQAVQPGVMGMQKRYFWKDLETAQGNYTFANVQADLQLATVEGIQLIVMIEDKTFNSKDGKPTPAYLSSYALPTKTSGYVAKRWDPYVVERMNALTAALGAQFDAHPNFEGIAFQESAIGLTRAVENANGYTPLKYRDALTEMLVSASQSFPSSRIFWYMNYLDQNQAYLADIAAAVAAYGVVMGGPDVLPDAPDLVARVYPMYAQFKGRMPLFGAMQFASFAHLHVDTSAPTKYWPLNDVFLYARDELHVNYVLWTRVSKPKPADSYFWPDAVPVIGNNLAFNQD